MDSSYSIVKLCDFGATLTGEELRAMSTTNAYIVARYYRAPEIILGALQDTALAIVLSAHRNLLYINIKDYSQKNSAIDIWATGVTLLELFRGGLVFTGASNNQILWEMMNALGPIPKKVLKDCR